MEPPALPTSYFEWLEDVKQNIRSMQAKASRQVNTSLLALYREMGKQIVEKQERENWGNAIVDRLAGDLRREFPGTSGFSRSNLFYMRQFYLFYRDAPEFVQQAAGQIPWWHNVLIFTHAQSIAEATFYIHKTIENNWSRNSIGLILCKSKSRIEAEYALRNLKSPIGVSDFLFTASLPDDFDQQLPSVAFIEKEIETRLAKHSPDKNTNTGQ